MTQALLNNLNTVQDNNLPYGEGVSKAGADFSKILDSKTFNKTEKASVSIIESDNEDATINNVCTIGNLKAFGRNCDSTIATEINTAAEESIAEAIVDLTVIKTVFADSDEQETQEKLDSTTDNTMSQEENLISDNNNDINDETNITEEDPTMLNELNTLDNPTAALLLHSQQLLVTLTSTDEDVSRNEDNLNLDLKETKSNLANNTAVFKQFDNSVSKNVQIANVIQKDDSNANSERSTLHKAINEKIVKDLNVEVVSQNTSENNFSGNNSSGNLMQNQTPQEQAAKVMIQGDLKFESVSIETAKVSDVKPTDISPSKIIEQISKQLDKMYNNSKLSIILNPEKLGKVNLDITTLKGGLTAQFTVTTQEARDILMKGLDGLRESLLAQGVSVDNVSVKLEETENEYNPDWTEQENSQGGNKHQGARKQKDESKLFEEIIGTELESEESNKIL